MWCAGMLEYDGNDGAVDLNFVEDSIKSASEELILMLTQCQEDLENMIEEVAFEPAEQSLAKRLE